MIPIKSVEQVEKMRQACSVAAEILEGMCEAAKPGMTTYDLDLIGRDLIAKHGATSACFNYQVGDKKYPAYTCISVNEEVVHGVGTLNRVLKEGDIVSLDVCVDYNGFIGDNACTIILGTATEDARKLVRVTEEALKKGIQKAISGNRVGDISHAIQQYVESNGFSVLREFVGHGVGENMHEEPQIPNYGKKNTGPKLKPGMTLAIEPMVNFGKPAVRYAADGLTVVTSDKLPSAHAEHTVLITKDEPEILTFSKKREKMLEQF